MVELCFVCLGNICRSPTGEGVMRHLVREAGLDAHVKVESAGTAGYHAGDAPDPRARRAGARRGIEIGGKARQFERADFDRFDYVLAMDRSNYDELLELAGGRPTERKLFLLRSFDLGAPRGAAVPDPYYGGDDGFDQVIDMCFDACRPLLAHIRKEHGF
jgi:protein-tyrosine phosphatase